jgi:hypothetical protein
LISDRLPGKILFIGHFICGGSEVIELVLLGFGWVFNTRIQAGYVMCHEGHPLID